MADPEHRAKGCQYTGDIIIQQQRTTRIKDKHGGLCRHDGNIHL